MTLKDDEKDFRKKRLDQLFDECQEQVISNIIGPFGLSKAMFEDKNGGNVTTLRNFERADDDYVATDSDKLLHANSKEAYDVEVRKQYEIKSGNKATEKDAQGNPITWDDKRERKMQQGQDDYTGQSLPADANGTSYHLDHSVSVKKIHKTPKNHLALGKVVTDESGEKTVDVTLLRALVNDDSNLALMQAAANISKSDEDLMVWGNQKRENGKTNFEHFGIDPEKAKEIHTKATQHIESTANNALLRKQTTELITTGGRQALSMGLRQSMGLLLTELVNGLFNEIKHLIINGIEAGKTLIEDVIARFKRVMQNVASRFKDAMQAFLEGGISGFMSNLLTFLINNLVSTSKKVVRMIREGLLGLYKALKMLFFPPKNMTSSEALQAGLKILSATVMVSAGILLEESLAAFLSAFPLLAPIAGMLTTVLVGIVTGILTALLAYQIDVFFHGLTEKNLDELMVNEQLRNQLAHTLSESLLRIRQDQIHINKRAEEISALHTSTTNNLDQFERLMAQAEEKN